MLSKLENEQLKKQIAESQQLLFALEQEIQQKEKDIMFEEAKNVMASHKPLEKKTDMDKLTDEAILFEKNLEDSTKREEKLKNELA